MYTFTRVENVSSLSWRVLRFHPVSTSTLTCPSIQERHRTLSFFLSLFPSFSLPRHVASHESGHCLVSRVKNFTTGTGIFLWQQLKTRKRVLEHVSCDVYPWALYVDIRFFPQVAQLQPQRDFTFFDLEHSWQELPIYNYPHPLFREF